MCQLKNENNVGHIRGKCMDAHLKRKPVAEMTTEELLHELIYSDDAEQYVKNKEHMAKYLGAYTGLYGK